jgi:hypothetical protein
VLGSGRYRFRFCNEGCDQMLAFNSAMLFFIATKTCRIPLSAGIRSLPLPVL